jgi:hypothetical protein
MENLSTWEIVGIVLLILLFGGIIWRIAKKLFAIAVVAALILLGIYFVSPETLYDWFGKDNVEKIENVVKEETNEAKETIKKETTEFVDELDSN